MNEIRLQKRSAVLSSSTGNIKISFRCDDGWRVAEYNEGLSCFGRIADPSTGGLGVSMNRHQCLGDFGDYGDLSRTFMTEDIVWRWRVGGS